MGYKRLTAEIDLDAVDFNIKSIIKRVDGRAKLIGTVKADAYGHGAIEVARVLEENGVDIFSVAMLDEAINLRKQGLDKTILMLGLTPPEYIKEALEYDVILPVVNYAEAVKISEAAKELGKKAVIHIKLDTGMGRIGFRADCKETADEIEKISKLENIEINGIFTHFCTSDCKDKTFTKIQKERFINTVDAVEKRGIHIPLKHASASAGLMDFDDMFFNAVRPGIILYGYYPSDEVMKERLPLKPVMSLKTYVTFIKEIEKGDSLGYGRTYIADEKRTIATIPAGYADGYNRLLSNKGRVLVNGKSAPIKGRICMDQFMVDITGIDAKEWDEVVLLGKQGNDEITADEIADTIGTISYEVLCMVSKRVPRVYIRNGKVIEEKNYLI